MEQLTPHAFGSLVAGLTPPQRTVLLRAVGGRVDGRANVLAALRRKSLVKEAPPFHVLTVLGRRLRAGLLVPPGSFGSSVVQALLDGGLSWDELPSGTLRGWCRVETFQGATSAYVDTRTLNGGPDAEALAEAEKVLLAAGFHVTRTESRTPRLLVSEERGAGG